MPPDDAEERDEEAAPGIATALTGMADASEAARALALALARPHSPPRPRPRRFSLSLSLSLSSPCHPVDWKVCHRSRSATPVFSFLACQWFN